VACLQSTEGAGSPGSAVASFVDFTGGFVYELAEALQVAGVALANHSLLPQAQWPPTWASDGRVDELAYSKLVAYASACD
jgi:hypothetical protein